MQSIWLATHRSDFGGVGANTDAFEPEATYDDVIVGGGLTGLVTALLFARRGHTVAVLEAATVGSLATGSSSAMLSLLQGTQLQKIKRRTYKGIVDAYVQGNREAFDWLIGYASDAGVDVQRRDAYTYATSRRGLARVDAEYQIGRAAGLDIAKTFDVDLPFNTLGAVRLRDQGQFDPIELVAALVSDIRALGGVVVEHARVTGVDASDPAVTHTELGDVRSERVHLTTGAPILDRGLYFAKIAPRRSFGIAFRDVPEDDLPDAFFHSAEAPTRSVRRFRDLLLVGGNEHGVGRAASEAALVNDLTTWTRSHWRTADATRVWSGQDYATPHGVPFVGWLPRGRKRIYLATGYDSWGMTNAVSAARMLVSDVLGDNSAWMTAIHHRATLPIAMAAGLGENAAVAWHFARGWGKMLTNPLLPGEIPPEGRGRVGVEGFTPVARSTVDGTTCAVSAVCPHLAGVVTWNDEVLSWDCPLHGSRFAADGSVIEGPAKRGLPSRDD